MPFEDRTSIESLFVETVLLWHATASCAWGLGRPVYIRHTITSNIRHTITLILLRTHVVLVRVACGSNICYTITVDSTVQTMVTPSYANACHSYQNGMWPHIRLTS